MFVCLFTIVGLGQTFGQDPAIICPADITLSSDADYTDTGLTGLATAFDINGQVDVEFTDIIINLDTNNDGFVRRRFNVVDRSDIFCDQTITMGTGGSLLICQQNIVVSLTSGPVAGESKAKVYAQSFVQNIEAYTDIKVSRDGVYFSTFAEFFCCDVGLQPYYVQGTNENGDIETCSGQVLIEDKVAPIINESFPIYLALYGQNGVELTADMLSNNAHDNCGIESATFSQSTFSSAGEYLVNYTISDVSGNTTQGTITVIVPSGNSIACNNNVNVSLDLEGQAVITPDMILEGFILANANYSVSINGGPFNKTGLLTCSDQGTVNEVTIRDDNSGNTCWSTIVIEDKIPPILSVPSTIYLTLNVPTEALLTVDMLDRFTFENCTIASQSVSLGLFASAGIYDVTYTVTDEAGNSTSQTFQVNVYFGPTALACNDQTGIILGADETITLDFYDILEPQGSISLNGNYTVGIGYAPDYEPTVYSESLTLDCSHIGADIALAVLDGATGNKCWGGVTVLDKKAPTPYAHNTIIASMNGSEPYVLFPSLIDLGSFDNCGGPVSMTVTPHTFTVPGTYEVKLRVYDESGNSDFATSTLILGQGEGTSIECIGISTALTGQFGPTTLYAEDFVLNDDDFDSFSMSTNPNGPYTESIDFDCSQYNLDAPIDVYVLGNNNGILSACTVSLTLVDNVPPVVIVKQNITLSLINGQATLTPEMLDNGSYDLCGVASLSLSQTQFTTAHLGANQVFLTATDQSGNTNQTWGTVTVIDGGESTMQCITLSTAVLNQFGPTTLYAVDFLLNPDDFASVTMATSQNGTYTETIDFDCVNYEINTPFNIFIKAGNSVETSTCIVSLVLQDNVIPIAIADQNITLQLTNGQATLFPQAVDDGSYDNCGSVSLSLSQTLFTAAHIGDNQVTLTVTDESGNVNTVWAIVTVIGDGSGSGCTVNDIIFPADINITDADGVLANLTVENLQSFYNYTYEQANPYTIASCNNIVIAYTDQVINTSYGYKILRTFTSLDWLTTAIKTDVQVIKLYTSTNTSLSCIDNVTVNVDNGSVELFPEDLLAGTNYDYSTISLTIEFNGDIVADNIITLNYIGQTLTYTVTDSDTGNSCWGTINVVDYESECPMNIDTDVTFPLDVIYIPETSVPADQLTPGVLVSTFGFALENVDVSIHPVATCTLIGYTYEDNVFLYTDGNYKIVRTFTVIDWYTYEPQSTEGIYTHVQVINVGINPNNLICDVLPNNAPAGDCDTGHSLEDDVEWPSDLSVADYRITPDGLIEFSNVPEKDARPIFFNTPDDYSATYVDLLVELTPSTLTVARIWKAVNNTYDITWNYSQTIMVDFSGFENLVSVTTATDRAVPGVIFNSNYQTNMEGETQVLGDIISIDFDDEVLNGVNVRDLILIQRHILGLEDLDERLTLASDIDSNGNITAADVLDLRKRILGVTNEIEWKFINTQVDNGTLIQPKATYVAYKKGDVDDSAILPGGEELPVTAKLTIEDKVLNNGETYMIPVSIEDENLLMGMEIRLGLNTDLLVIEGIENNLGFAMNDYNVSSDGELVIVISDFLNAQDPSLDANNAVVYIQCTAKANILLHDAIKVSNRTSYAVDENLELYVVGGEIENLITSTNSPELASLKVFPNPTVDYLRIDLSGVSAKGNLNVSILNTQGQLIKNQSSDVIDVQDLTPGMYYYKITIGEHETKGKFIVVR